MLNCLCPEVVEYNFFFFPPLTRANPVLLQHFMSQAPVGLASEFKCKCLANERKSHVISKGHGIFASRPGQRIRGLLDCVAKQCYIKLSLGIPTEDSQLQPHSTFATGLKKVVVVASVARCKVKTLCVHAS